MKRTRAPALPGTELDRMVTEILTHSEVPLSAYDLIARISERGRLIAGMTVYRSLDRLCGEERIEKVEMLSAYRIKDRPKAVLLICTVCRRATSLAVPVHYNALAQALKAIGFASDRLVIEAAGKCADCSSREGG